MKNSIAILVVIFFTASCLKPSGKTYRYVGWIYNANDSLPFVNTKFKIYNDGTVTTLKDDQTFEFSTDSAGHFDVVVPFLGLAVWPSYHHGATYMGPIDFSPLGDSLNKALNQWTTYFKSYTTPYF